MEPCTKETDIEQIKISVQRIESALLGDKYNPDGLLKRVDSIEKKVEKTDRKILVYTSMTSGFITGLGLIFKSIFK